MRGRAWGWMGALLLCGALWGCAAAPSAPLEVSRVWPALAVREGAQGAWASEGSSPSVVAWGPTQEQEQVSAVAVTFDRPMDPSTPLRLDPEVAGEQRWLGPWTVIFVPDAPLPPASHFVAWVPEGSKALDGTSLGQDFLWTFTTLRPALVEVTPPHEGLLVDPRGALWLRFNQPIDLASLQQRAGLSWEDQAQYRAERFSLEPGLDAQGRPDLARVAVVPARPIPPGAKVELTIQPGLQGAQGKLPCRRPWKHAAFTPDLFRALPVACADAGHTPKKGCDPDAGFLIPLSATPAEDSAAALVSDPPIPPEQVQAEGQALRVTGPLAASARYKLSLGSSARDQSGRPLAKPWRAIVQTRKREPAQVTPAPVVVVVEDAPLPEPAPSGVVLLPRAQVEPGGALYARAWLLPREGPPSALAGREARAQVLDPDGAVAWERSAPLDEVGSAGVAWRAPVGAAPGEWTLQVLGPDGAGASARFRLGEPPPPPELRASPARSRLVAGEPLEASISAPGLARRALPWRLKLEPVAWSAPGLPGYVFGEPGAAPSSFYKEGSLALDERGEGSLRLPLKPLGRGAWRWSLMAVVEGRELPLAQGELLPGELGAGLQAKRGLVRAGERVVVRVAATNREGQAVSRAQLRATLERQAPDAGGALAWREVSVCRGETGAAPVVCGFTPAEPGRWRVRVSGQAAGAQAVEGVWPLWVASGDGPGLAWGPDEPPLVLDRDEALVGERLLALVRAPSGGASAELTLSGAGGARRAVALGRFEGWRLLELPLGLGESPWVDVSLRWRGASGEPLPPADRRVRVEPLARALEVRVQAPSGPPGARVEVQVEALRGGQPAKAKLTLALLDEVGSAELPRVEPLIERAWSGAPTPARAEPAPALYGWRGEVWTDAQGRARLEWTLPEEPSPPLRLVAWANDGAGAVGVGEARLETLAPLDLRVASAPSRGSVGDEPVVELWLTNRGPQAADVEWSLEAEGGAVLLGEPSGRATLAPQERRVLWARVSLRGAGVGRLRALARADEGQARQLVSWEIAPNPQEARAALGGVWAERAKLPVQAPPGAEGGRVKLRLDAAPWVKVWPLWERVAREPERGDLDDLSGRLLAAGALLGQPEARARLGEAERARLEEGAARWLEGIGALQQPEGGFAEWPQSPQVDVPKGLRAATALEVAQAAGLPVPAPLLRKARAWVALLLARKQAPLTQRPLRADELAQAAGLLSWADPSAVSVLSDLEPLLARADELCAEGLGWLAVAWFRRTRQEPAREVLRGLLERAERRADVEESSARFARGGQGAGAAWVWALSELAPDHPLARWLASDLLATQPATLFDEALALWALGRLQGVRPWPGLGAGGLRAWWGGALALEVAPGSLGGWAEVPWSPGGAWVLEADEGATGALYAEGAWALAPAPSVAQGVAVVRSWETAQGEPLEGVAALGEEVVVRLTLVLPSALEGVVLEDAGGPCLAPVDAPTRAPLSQVRAFPRATFQRAQTTPDHRALFWAEALGPGIVEHVWRARVVCRGVFLVPPARLGPTLGDPQARSAASRLEVE